MTVLSDEYINRWLGKRFPVTICLPNREWWHIDAGAPEDNNTGFTLSGWEVEGTCPDQSQLPSTIDWTAYPEVFSETGIYKLSHGKILMRQEK